MCNNKILNVKKLLIWEIIKQVQILMYIIIITKNAAKALRDRFKVCLVTSLHKLVSHVHVSMLSSWMQPFFSGVPHNRSTVFVLRSIIIFNQVVNILYTNLLQQFYLLYYVLLLFILLILLFIFWHLPPPGHKTVPSFSCPLRLSASKHQSWLEFVEEHSQHFRKSDVTVNIN